MYILLFCALIGNIQFQFHFSGTFRLALARVLEKFQLSIVHYLTVIYE